jgi:hypothetical protein
MPPKEEKVSDATLEAIEQILQRNPKAELSRYKKYVRDFHARSIKLNEQKEYEKAINALDIAERLGRLVKEVTITELSKWASEGMMLREKFEQIKKINPPTTAATTATANKKSIDGKLQDKQKTKLRVETSGDKQPTTTDLSSAASSIRILSPSPPSAAEPISPVRILSSSPPTTDTPPPSPSLTPLSRSPSC